jgi:hypothetical protein
MPRISTRVLLFLSSYAPLFFILALRAWTTNRDLAIGLGSLSTLSIVSLALFLKYAFTLQSAPQIVTSVKSRDGDVMSYIVTYLLPFLAIKLNDMMDITSLGLLLAVVGILYVNSNLIHTNPILSLMGYHLFEIEDENKKTTTLICKRTYIKVGSEIHAVSVGDYVLLEKL